jgi:hypothetical protein
MQNLIENSFTNLSFKSGLAGGNAGALGYLPFHGSDAQGALPREAYARDFRSTHRNGLFVADFARSVFFRGF